MPGLDVKAACGYMTNAAQTPLQNLADFNAAAAKQAQQKCIDNSYADMIAQLSNTTVDKTIQGVGMRQWTFQVWHVPGGVWCEW